MDNHSLQWNTLHTAFLRKKLAHALFFVGPLHCDLNQFVLRLAQLILCHNKHNAPCCNCADCHMVHRREHPDIEWILPEKSGSVIKIDQIRQLQLSAYLTPQRSESRIIVIEAADRMNNASANALLKILEEPAQHTRFILIAEQLSTVLPTILSRCQLMKFSVAEDNVSNILVQLGKHYPKDSARGLIIQQAEFILDGLIALLEKKQHPCTLAALWTQFELSTLLWFLYLVYSQLQHMYISPLPIEGLACAQLEKLKFLLSPLLIFSQLDEINNISRKLSHNINVNQLLVLEHLLFSLGIECN